MKLNLGKPLIGKHSHVFVITLVGNGGPNHPVNSAHYTLSREVTFDIGVSRAEALCEIFDIAVVDAEKEVGPGLDWAVMFYSIERNEL